MESTTVVVEKSATTTVTSKPIRFEDWKKSTVDFEYTLICVVGDHAGENADNFFTRKIKDTQTYFQS